MPAATATRTTAPSPAETDLMADPSLDDLTARERDIFDQLALHKTSKEVANDVGVTVDTVNKHIASVRAKWSAVNRFEAIRTFEALRAQEDPVDDGETAPPHNLAPQFLPHDTAAEAASDPMSDLPGEAVFQLSDVFVLDGSLPEAPAPRGLEALDERFGKAWRIVAVPLIAVLLGIVLVCMLTVAKTLSEMI